MCSARYNLTASSSWSRSCCYSLCLHYISCRCFSRILVLFCEILEWAGEDIIIQKQEQKNFLFCYILLIKIPSWNFQINSIRLQRLSPKGGILSYASLSIWKLYHCSKVTSKTYNLAFYGSYLSCNISYGSAVIIWVFCLLWQRYFHSTQSSMTELLLLVSQHWNPEYLLYYPFVYKTSSYTIIC